MSTQGLGLMSVLWCLMTVCQPGWRGKLGADLVKLDEEDNEVLRHGATS